MNEIPEGPTRIPKGVLTALITPLHDDGAINRVAMEKLIDFQISQKVSGIVSMGTTGEASTLDEKEHCRMISCAIQMAKGIFVLSGCGSNCTKEVMGYVKEVSECGGEAVLLVDPYYNRPSSLEIRKEYYEPIARAFPNMTIVPYLIPGRTGCQLSPQDLMILAQSFPNVCAVKDATGDRNNMTKIRSLVSREFQIFSGDDKLAYLMMNDCFILAHGVISVISNIAPAAVQEMCLTLLAGDRPNSEEMCTKLKPLFDIVTVSCDRSTKCGTVSDRFPNPVPIKTAMNGLGMPAGPCRQPLGKMSTEGVEKVRTALLTVNNRYPEIFAPIEKFFEVDVVGRLANNSIWRKLAY